MTCIDTGKEEINMNTDFGRTRAAMLATIALALVADAAIAKDVKLSLTGSEETPPVTTSATGTGTLEVAKDKSVSGSIKTSGIDGTAAHIHVGAPGQSGPPIITLVKGADGTWSVPPDS